MTLIAIKIEEKFTSVAKAFLFFDVDSDQKVSVAEFLKGIELSVFVPDYSKDDRRNFVMLSQLERGASDINHKLANIFYEDAAQEFNLSHGYRAQTHLGSYLMYHAFIEEIKNSV